MKEMKQFSKIELSVLCRKENLHLAIEGRGEAPFSDQQLQHQTQFSDGSL